MKSLQLVGVPSPHALIATICLASMDEHREPLVEHMRIGDGSRLDGLERPLFGGETGRTYISGHPLLKYAHEHWGYHAKLSQFGGCIHPSLHLLLTKDVRYPISLPAGPNSLSSFHFHFEVLADMEMVTGAHLAAMHGLVDFLQPFHGPIQHLSDQSVPGGYTPFHLAAMCGQFQAFQALCSSLNGANLRSPDGSTALHVAVEYRRTAFIKHFCEFVCSQRKESLDSEDNPAFILNAQDLAGKTPFFLACETAQEEVVRIFASCEQVDINLRDNGGYTAFQRITQCRDLDGKLWPYYHFRGVAKILLDKVLRGRY